MSFFTDTSNHGFLQAIRRQLALAMTRAVGGALPRKQHLSAPDSHSLFKHAALMLRGQLVELVVQPCLLAVLLGLDLRPPVADENNSFRLRPRRECVQHQNS